MRFINWIPELIVFTGLLIAHIAVNRKVVDNRKRLKGN